MAIKVLKFYKYRRIGPQKEKVLQIIICVIKAPTGWIGALFGLALGGDCSKITI